MTLIVRPGILYDADALAYMELVKAADAAAGQTGGLEQGVIDAINDFVVGCKTDGIWSAIKASCILAGARTLAGALVPLAGTAPTNVNFVSGDYNRKTGLVGNGTSKYLNSNRNNNADPQNSKHVAAYATAAPTASTFPAYIGMEATLTGASLVGIGTGTMQAYYLANTNTAAVSVTGLSGTGFVGATRASSSVISGRFSGVNYSASNTSQNPSSVNIFVFAESVGRSSNYSNARLAFYSIGESLDLAALDARVTALITAFGVAIP
jgi:hypothetical protein